jgi:ubiquitin carboxyl-terminal hydrolase 10
LKDLARLMGQRTDGGTTVLVDATVRFLDEFAYKDKPPITQKSLQLVVEKESKEKNDIDGTDPFLPTYVYNAMKEKRRLHVMLVRTCAHVTLFCY